MRMTWQDVTWPMALWENSCSHTFSSRTSSVIFHFSFLKFLLYMLFLVLKSDVQSISLLSPHPWASAGLLEKGWVSVSKSQYSHQRNLPFLPGPSICACRFIHKYRLNTLCVAAGPALWQISESIRHSSGFVVLILYWRDSHKCMKMSGHSRM